MIVQVPLKSNQTLEGDHKDLECSTSLSLMEASPDDSEAVDT